MENLSNKSFETIWGFIFLFMFVLIMVPFPIFYSTTYIPSFGGIPLFMFGWIAHAVVTFILIFIYYKMCMKRKEYHIYDEEN